MSFEKSGKMWELQFSLQLIPRTGFSNDERLVTEEEAGAAVKWMKHLYIEAAVTRRL